MLEKVALQLLNRFLGSYVENLDAANLKLGIFSGNAVLENLKVRGNALDDLDIPFRVKVGHIGRLTLGVPWKTMLTSSDWTGRATLDDVFIILVPQAAVHFDPEKDTKERFDSKIKQLEQIEMSLASKSELAAAQAAKKAESDDTWIDKLVADCVRNFQVHIRNIHVRYEDAISNTQAPFACGVSFANLSYNLRTVSTADVLRSLLWSVEGDRIVEGVPRAADNRICTQLCLESFAVYIEPLGAVWSDLPRDTAVSKMRDAVTSGGCYVLRPLRLDCAVWIDMRPAASGYTRPKFEIACRLPKIEFELARAQYVASMNVVCEFQRVLIQSRYVRYQRPSGHVMGASREWWHFAYRVILNEKVKRELRKWKRAAVDEHIRKCRAYKALYVKVLNPALGALTQADQATLMTLTNELDVFNIIRLRQRAAVELAKAERDRQKQKEKRSWSSYLWSSSKPTQAPADTQRSQTLLSDEEKDQLRRLVESSSSTDEIESSVGAPPSFVSLALRTRFDEVTLRLTDAAQPRPIAALLVKTLLVGFSQRPTAKSIKLTSHMQSLVVIGTEHDAFIARSVETSAGQPFVAASFETNPAHAEQISAALHVAVRPVHLFVDTTTANAIIHFITLPRSIKLRKALSASQSSVRQNVDAFLRKRYRNEVSIDIEPSVMLLPANGVYGPNVTTLAVSFGRLALRSVELSKQQLEARVSHACDAASAYDVYKVTLTDVQCVLARRGENWSDLLTRNDINHQLIAPISLDMTLKQCALLDDARFEQVRMEVALQLLRVAVSDGTLREALNVLLSIKQRLEFTSESKDDSEGAMRHAVSIDSSVALDETDEFFNVENEIAINRIGKEADADSISVSSGFESDDEEQRISRRRRRLAELEAQRRREDEKVTQFAFQFAMNKLEVALFDQTQLQSPLAQFDLETLCVTFAKRTFDESVSVQAGAIKLLYRQFVLLHSAALDMPTLAVTYMRVDEDAPSFVDIHERTAMRVELLYERLHVALHREKIEEAASYLLVKYAQLVSDWHAYTVAEPLIAKTELANTAQESQSELRAPQQDENKGLSAYLLSANARSTIPLRVNGVVRQLAIDFSDEQHGTFASIRLDSLDAKLRMQFASVYAHVALGNLVFRDLGATRYADILAAVGTTKQLVTIDVIVNDKALIERLLQNGIALFPPETIISDCDIRLAIGRVRFVYLQPFLNRIVQTLEPLQVPLANMQAEMRDASKKIASQAQNLQLVERVITLDAQFDAPVVEVPRTANDDNRLTIDLGRLTLTRTYALDTEGRLSNLVHVALTDLQVAADSHAVLRPTSFTVALGFSNRALADGQLVPDLQLDARLAALRVELQESDTELIAAIYCQNVVTYTQILQPSSSIQPVSTAQLQQLPTNSVSQEDRLKALEKTVDSVARMQIGVCVTFEQLTMALHSRNAEIAPSGQLACFELSSLTLDLKVSPDAEIKARLSAARWALDDLRVSASRPTYEGITRLIENGSGHTTKNNLLVLNVTVPPSKQIDVNVNIDGVSVCASIEFINALVVYLNAFVQPLAVLSSDEKKSVRSGPVQHSRVPVREPSESSSSLQLSTRFRLNASQLVLVERIETRKSDALVLCFETHGSLQLPDVASKRLSLNCELRLTDLLCCPYETAARAGRTSRVLDPVSISLIVNRTECPSATRVNIDTNDFVLHVSPPLIRFAGATLQAVVAATQHDSPIADVDTPRIEDVLVPAGFWNCRPIASQTATDAQDASWFLANPEAEGDIENSDMDEAMELDEMNFDKLAAPTEQLMIRVPRVVVNIEDAVDVGSTMPLLCLETSLEGEVFDWSSVMRLNASCTVNISYYNDHVGFWEPLLEPVELPDSTFTPFSFDLEVHRNLPRIRRTHSMASCSTLDTDTDTDVDGDGDDEAAISVLLSSAHILNCTLTDASIKLLLRTIERFSSVFNLAADTLEAASDANFIFYNETGAPLVLALDPLRFRFINPPSPSSVPLGVVLNQGDALHLRELGTASAHLRSPPSPLHADSNLPVLRRLTGGVSSAALISYTNIAAQRSAVSFDVSLLDESFKPAAVTLSGCSETKVVELFDANVSPRRLLAVGMRGWRKARAQAAQSDGPVPKLLSVNVSVSLQRTELRFRSAIQLRNELPVPVAIGIINGSQPVRVWTSLRPLTDAYLPVAYATRDTKLSFAPLTVNEKKRFDELTQPEYDWSAGFSLFERNHTDLICSHLHDVNKSFVLKVCTQLKQREREIGMTVSSLSALYTYSLRPLIRFCNLLPIPVTLRQDMNMSTVPMFIQHPDIESGVSVDLCDVPFSKMQLELRFFYCGFEWRASWLPVCNPSPTTELKFRRISNDNSVVFHILTLNNEYTGGVLNVTLYAKYWLLNKTGLDLIYEFHKAGKDGTKRVEQSATMLDPIILSSKEKWLRKETVSFTVKDKGCGFTEPFSLDAVGTNGKVECKQTQPNGQLYPFGVKIELSATGLTKIVTITPYFVIINHLNRDVRVLDSGGSNASVVHAHDVSAFWPKHSGSNLRISIEVPFRLCEMNTAKNDSQQQMFLYSPPFSLQESMQSLFRLSDAGALSVDVRASEDNVAVLLGGYKAGLCCLRIVNDTNFALFVRQAKADGFLEVSKQSSVMYALSNTDLPRAVEWSLSPSPSPTSLKSCDLTDSVNTVPDSSFVQLCFMDGAQRVLLFTSRASYQVLNTVLANSRNSSAQMAVTLRLNAIGLSLVNTVLRQEILHARLFSRGALWRREVKTEGKDNQSRLRRIEADLGRHIETAYQKYINSGRRADLATFKQGNCEVDFSPESPVMRKPNLSTLKRSHEPGIWLQLRRNVTNDMLHVKLQLLQIDSPLPDAQFTTIFAVVPPRSTSGNEYEEFLTRPFFELSLVLDKQARANVLQFKFLKVLLQEAFVHVDRCAIIALLTFVQQILRRQIDMFGDFQRDHSKVVKSLRDALFDEFGGSGEQIHYFGQLHLSPVKLSLSVALGGERNVQSGIAANASVEQNEQDNTIDKFLHLTGISVADTSDILLKLGFFERKDRFYTQARLLREIQSHYVRIAMRQLLKFLFGLDVIGNPYGVFRDLRHGVEDLFYEPINGAMEGPREFVQGMQHGVTSLLKNTLGGVAGGASRITGTLGKVLASATFDDKFKQDRAKKLREHKSDSVSKNLATGAGNVVMSVGQAAFGVFTKPVEGAKQAGTAGFFKGFGKGLIGLVTLPTATLADAASSALQSVQHVTNSGFKPERVRLPRYVGPRTALRPYLTREATAASIMSLKKVVGDTPFTYDEYVFHAMLSSKPNFQSLMIITDLRSILVTRENLQDTRHWRTDLTLWLDELDALPSWTPQGAKFATRDEKLVVSKTGVHNITMQFEDAQLGQFIVTLLQQILQRKYGWT